MNNQSKSKRLPLEELSIAKLYNGDRATYEVPIYQRNYAWEKEEIHTLIQDVFDAYTSEKQVYFIGTLVTFRKGDQVYEVIDGQQRMTTINLILSALGIPMQNKLTYRARKKSNETISNLTATGSDEIDQGIINGFKYTKGSIDDVIPKGSLQGFRNYFLNNVRLIRYQVPKDIDLNHYFEVMNSRGEQLEKHEIIKARLIEKLDDRDKAKFDRIWESCSEMNVYIQQKYDDPAIFGADHDNFIISSFDDLPPAAGSTGMKKISELITGSGGGGTPEDDSRLDTFQPIMDFSNFLLIVLKLTRMKEKNFDPAGFNLDDKELLKEFDKVPRIDAKFVKRFGFNLLMAKFLLDNYIVHHSNDDDTVENNPWKLQYWYKPKNKGYLRNLDEDSDAPHKLVHLLSLFEVSFTARQRKNYLFYCLLYLFNDSDWDVERYCGFVAGLADKFFYDVYLDSGNLNEINTPRPGSFDGSILKNNRLDITRRKRKPDFSKIYGDGSVVSAGIPLFVFNYLDYKLWEKYAVDLRGERVKEGSKARKAFFSALGCSDLTLKAFDQFYFSRTRRSLEHYYPQANANGKKGALTEAQINCLGNFAMIGSEANSSGSNWSPKVKLDHYLDASGKVRQVSVASLKFLIMMQICKDNQHDREPGQEWDFRDITEHQRKMLEILDA